MKIKILVINDESLSAAAVSDERLARGFTRNPKLITKGDYIRSDRYNRLLSLNAMLSDHVLFTLEDIYGFHFKLMSPKAKNELGDTRSFVRDLSDAQFLDAFEFYGLEEHSIFDVNYIEKSFDGVFMFFNKPRSMQNPLNDAIASLLSSPTCPPLMIFNFAIEHQFINQILTKTNKVLSGNASISTQLSADMLSDIEYCLNKILTRASSVSVADKPTLESLELYYKSLNEALSFHHMPSIKTPKLYLAHNGYYNFRRADTTMMIARTYTFAQEYARHGFKEDQSHCDNYLYSANPFYVSPVDTEFASVKGDKPSGSVTKAAQMEPVEAQINNFRYLCVDVPATLEKGVFDETLVSSTKLGPESYLLSESKNQFTIAISSKYLGYHPTLGVDVRGVRLILSVREAFPNARIVLFLNESFYSYLEQIESPDIVLDGAKQWRMRANVVHVGTRAKRISKSNSDAGLLSNAIVNIINESIASHQKTEAFLSQDLDVSGYALFDGTHFPDSLRAECDALPSVVSDCYLNLDYDNLFKEEIDLLISDHTHEIIAASSNSIATLHLTYDNDSLLSHKIADSNYILALILSHFNFDVVEPLYEHCKFIASEIANGQAHLRRAARDRFRARVAESSQSSESFSIEAMVENHFVLTHNMLPFLSFENILTKKRSVREQILDISHCYNFDFACSIIDSYYKECEIFESHLKDCFYAFYQKADKLPTHKIKAQMTLMPDSLKRPEVKDKYDLQEETRRMSEGKRIAQFSNYTYNNRYALVFSYLRFFNVLLHAPSGGMLSQNGAALARTFEEIDSAYVSLKHATDSMGSDLEFRAISDQEFSPSHVLIDGVSAPLFKPLSLDILSFGCSRGEEVMDLLNFFNGQSLTGVDISADAIAKAQQLLMNLHALGGVETMHEFKRIYSLVPRFYKDYNTLDIGSLVETCVNTFVSLHDEEKRWLYDHSLTSNQRYGYIRPEDAIIKKIGHLGHISFLSNAEFFKRRQVLQEQIDEIIANSGIALKSSTNILEGKGSLSGEFLAGSSGYVAPDTKDNEASLLRSKAQLMRTLSTQSDKQEGSSILSKVCYSLLKDENLEQALRDENEQGSEMWGDTLISKLKLETYDVVTAMTVLCRHPETSRLQNASDIYPRAEFLALLEKLDSLVRVGGFLCIFNANYRLEDTLLNNKYIRIFPFYEGSQLVTIMDNKEATTRQESKSLSDYSSEFFSMMFDLHYNKESRSQKHQIFVTEYLRKLYLESDHTAKFGHTALFDSNENRILRNDLGAIFYKWRD